MKKRFWCFLVLFVFALVTTVGTSYAPDGQSTEIQKKSKIEAKKQRPPSKFERLKQDKERYFRLLNSDNPMPKVEAYSSEVELVGVWPYGSCLASALDTSRNIALIVSGLALQVLDISTPASPSVIGEVVFDEKPNVIAISGNYAYVCVQDFYWGQSILKVIDITDPTTPAEINEVSFSGGCGWIDISSNTLCVAAGYDGLKIFDITDPTAPAAVGTYTEGGILVYEVALWNNYALIVNEYYDDPNWIDEMRVVNISSPGSPVLTGTYQAAVGYFITGIDVVPSGTAYITELDNLDYTGSNLTIIDVATDPAIPAVLGSHEDTLLRFEEVQVQGDYAYVYDRWDCALTVIDISDPTSTTLEGWAINGCSFNGMDLSGSYVGISANEDGFELYDISDPANPSYVSSFETPDDVDDVVVSGDYAYLGNRSSGLRIIDISDPTNPSEVGLCDTVMAYGRIAVSGDYAYCVPYWTELWVVDVSTPSAPTQVYNYYDGSWETSGICVQGDYAYLVGTDWTGDTFARMDIYDVSTPTSPVFQGTYICADETYNVKMVAVSGHYAYIPVTDYSGGTEGPALKIVDILDPTAPSEVGSFKTTDGGQGFGVAIRGDYAFLVSINGSYGFRTIDITDPSSPSEIASIGSRGHDIKLSGSYAYLGDWGGLTLVDISDPTNPVEAGYYFDSILGPLDVSNGNHAYCTGSLVVLKNLLAPEVELTSPSPGATISGTVALSADATHTSGISQVEFYIDDVLEGTDTTAPFSHSWDTTVVPSGACCIRACAYNNDGKSSDTEEIEVMVVALYTLTIAAGTGGTTDPAVGGHDYPDGTPVDVTAYPDGAYAFNGWSGDVPSGHEMDNPVTIDMDADKSIMANFVLLDAKTLTVAASTGGTTTPAPGDHYYSSGTPVDVTALPDTGYIFTHWSGDVPSGHELDNPVTITMDDDKSLTANFAKIGWKSTKRLTWNPSDSSAPNVAVDTDGNVHMVWEDDNPGNYEIYYRRSTDGGTNWAGAKRLTWNSGDSRNPVITNDSDDNIHVVWDDDTPGRQEIYHRRSTDKGTTWKAVKRLTQLNGDSQVPAIAVDPSDYVHIVWFDMTPGNNEIYYSRSADKGVSWSNPKRMTWNASSSSYPCIAAGSGSDIHIVWQDDGPGNAEIFYKRSTNGGTSWPLTKRMTWNSGASMYPSIASDTGDNIHLVWTDLSPGNNEVFYKKSWNAGTNWPMTKRLTWNGGASGAPSVATDAGDNIYLVWNDDTPGNYEIFFKKSTNGGSAWATKRLTWNGGDSKVPDIATYSTGQIHIVWADSSPGNQEIYYRKAIQ